MFRRRRGHRIRFTRTRTLGTLIVELDLEPVIGARLHDMAVIVGRTRDVFGSTALLDVTHRDPDPLRQRRAIRIVAHDLPLRHPDRIAGTVQRYTRIDCDLQLAAIARPYGRHLEAADDTATEQRLEQQPHHVARVVDTGGQIFVLEQQPRTEAWTLD